MINKIRKWLIIKLIGKWGVIMNVYFESKVNSDGTIDTTVKGVYSNSGINMNNIFK
jgi:hypothetical protein